MVLQPSVDQKLPEGSITVESRGLVGAGDEKARPAVVSEEVGPVEGPVVVAGLHSSQTSHGDREGTAQLVLLASPFQVWRA